jgi:hypothetical protein
LEIGRRRYRRGKEFCKSEVSLTNHRFQRMAKRYNRDLFFFRLGLAVFATATIISGLTNVLICGVLVQPSYLPSYIPYVSRAINFLPSQASHIPKPLTHASRVYVCRLPIFSPFDLLAFLPSRHLHLAHASPADVSQFSYLRTCRAIKRLAFWSPHGRLLKLLTFPHLPCYQSPHLVVNFWILTC